MTKRLIASLLCVMLCGALPCLAEGGARTELFSRAMDLCALMDACAADPQYLSLYGLDAAARQEIGNMGSHALSDVRRADLYVLKDGFFSTWLSASKAFSGRAGISPVHSVAEATSAAMSGAAASSRWHSRFISITSGPILPAGRRRYAKPPVAPSPLFYTNSHVASTGFSVNSGYPRDILVYTFVILESVSCNRRFAML